MTLCQIFYRLVGAHDYPKVSLEQLDLLLLTVIRPRQVHRDGIRFQSLWYFDPPLTAFVGEAVTIRYDPADIAEIRLYWDDRFLCRAICQELAGETVSLRRRSRPCRTATSLAIDRQEPPLSGRPGAGPSFHATRRSPSPPAAPTAAKTHIYSDTDMSGAAAGVPGFRRPGVSAAQGVLQHLRRERFVGICCGPPGVGKTISARHYAKSNLLEGRGPLPVAEQVPIKMTDCDTCSTPRRDRRPALGRSTLDNGLLLLRD